MRKLYSYSSFFSLLWHNIGKQILLLDVIWRIRTKMAQWALKIVTFTLHRTLHKAYLGCKLPRPKSTSLISRFLCTNWLLERMRWSSRWTNNLRLSLFTCIFFWCLCQLEIGKCSSLIWGLWSWNWRRWLTTAAIFCGAFSNLFSNQLLVQISSSGCILRFNFSTICPTMLLKESLCTVISSINHHF